MEPKTSTNAEILVQGSCFFADKERMGSKSNYLKRLFELESSRITISPPLNITAQTFELIVGYCYGGSIVITPINVAALRIAAELLEMSTAEDGARGDNLCQKTEDYFKKAIDVNRKFVVMILQSCLSQMPEAETTANLVSKCIEALASKVDEGESIVNYLHDIKTVSYKDFELIAESLYKKLTGTAGQDLLYQIIDFYFEEHSGNVTDEQKTRICNYIDCKILSPQLLMHAVQNQRLPIRFVIKAVHIERLKAGGTIVSAANNHDSEKTECETADAHTLGALLQRDAALHQVAQLQATINVTSNRLESLEKELRVVKQIVKDNTEAKSNQILYSRSSSCRQGMGKVERGPIRSLSSTSLRRSGKKVIDEAQILGNDYNSTGSSSTTTKIEQKKFGRRLMNGLKSAFGVGTFNKKNHGGSKVHGGSSD